MSAPTPAGAQGGSLLAQARPLIVGRGLAALVTLALPMGLARALAPRDFGTYKQLFLVANTTLLVAQAGLAQSLYYFLPSGGPRRGRYLVQAAAGLALLGGAAGVALVAAAGPLASALGNPALGRLAVPLALIVAGSLASAPLEVALTAERRTGAAAIAYLTSDLVRAVAILVPTRLGAGLTGLAWGAAGVALLRALATGALVGAGALPRAAPDLGALRRQLRYAVPYAGAVTLSVAQGHLASYAVAAATDAATFALYAVGTLQLPIADLLYTPVSEVMMVRLARAPGEERAVFHEAVARLAALFFPLAGLAWASAPALIPALYTARYAAAVPLYLITACELPLSVLPCDGVLRARARTRALLWIGALRLGCAALLVPAGLRLLGPIGAVAGHVVAQGAARAATLARVARELPGRGALLPWRALARSARRAALAAAPAVAARTALASSPWAALLACGAAYGAAYLALLAVDGELRALLGGAPRARAVGGGGA